MRPLTLNKIEDLGKPAHSKDIVVKCDISFKTSSGIIATVIPEVLNDRPTFGEVVIKGDKVKNVDLGDIVYFPKHVGFDIHTNEFKDGIMYLLLDSKKLIGKIERN